MQILTNKQVSYCNVSTEKTGGKEYLPGISFQNKTYIKEKFFTLEDEHNAIKYCKSKYLADRGKKSYILVKDSTGLTVWMEDKTAKMLGIEDPLEIIKKIDLEDLVSQMRSVGGIKIKDRRHNLKVYKQCVVGSEVCQYLIDSLELSIEQAIYLGQRLIEEKWIHHVADQHSFKNEHLFYRFYWDED